MRKILLSLIMVGGIIAGANAQCTPDPQYTTSGIYPDSATGLPPAYIGHSYDVVITAVVPTDTMGFTIEYIELTGVGGLPPNFTYQCNPSNCQFPGGSSG